MSTFAARDKEEKEVVDPSAPKDYKAHADWKDVKMPLMPMSTWKDSTKRRVLPFDPALFKWVLRVKYNAGTFIMQTPDTYLDLETTPDDIGRMFGPTFSKGSGFPPEMVGSVYSVQLVKIRADSEGIETNITAREHDLSPTEYAVQEWKFERPNGGEIPKTVMAHLDWRRLNQGRLCEEPDPDDASDGDYRVDDIKFVDGEDDPRDAREMRGGRDRDRGDRDLGDVFMQHDRERDRDPDAPTTPFGGRPSPFGRDDRGGPAQPPPPRFDPTGWFVWSEPRGVRGEYKRCATHLGATWVGDHYEPTPLAPIGSDGHPAAEEPPIVNGLIFNGVAWVPAPHGATKINGRWIPLPDPNAANMPITNPARQLPPPPPPRPESHPDDSTYFLIDNQWTHCPGGIRLDAQSGQWVPRPPPPPIAKPVVEANVPPAMSFADKATILSGVIGAMFTGIASVTQPRIEAERAAEERRREAERAAEERRRDAERLAEERRREETRIAEDRRREEARIATERVKAEADAQKETARLMAEAQKEAAKLAADAQIKAAELNAERERAAREAEERRRDAQLDREREDRRREEDRKNEERKIEAAALLKREELATQARLAAEAAAEAERVRREQREREERIAAEKRMAEILALAKEKPPAPPPPPDFTRELERRRKEAEALGATFGAAASGDAASAATATVIGAVAERLTDVAGKYVDATLEARKLEARAAAQAPPASRQPAPALAPPPPGYAWHKFPDNSIGMVPVATPPAYVNHQQFMPPPPSLTSPPITVSGGVAPPAHADPPPYVQPETKQETHYGEEPSWGVVETPPIMVEPTQPDAAHEPEPRRSIIDFGDDYAPKRRTPVASTVHENAAAVNENAPENVARDNRTEIVETPVVAETPEQLNDAAPATDAPADPAAEAAIEPA